MVPKQVQFVSHLVPKGPLDSLLSPFSSMLRAEVKQFGRRCADLGEDRPETLEIEIRFLEIYFFSRSGGPNPPKVFAMLKNSRFFDSCKQK